MVATDRVGPGAAASPAPAPLSGLLRRPRAVRANGSSLFAGSGFPPNPGRGRTGARANVPAARTVIAAALVTAFGVLGGCATPPNPADREAVAEFQAINAPAEPLMRGVFEVNQVIDKLVLKPAATFYRAFMPPPFQHGINNALNNLRAPLVFIHDLLQGDTGRAGTTLTRFAINTTVGILGVRDAAADMGYPYHNEDMGQTLAVWGMAEGPYVVLPVFGPSNPRDAIGLAVDFVIDPFNLWMKAAGESDMILARGGGRAVDDRAGVLDTMDDLERSSLDFYATIRSLYRQRRNDEIRNGHPAHDLPQPGLTDNPGRSPQLGQADFPVLTP